MVLQKLSVMWLDAPISWFQSHNVVLSRFTQDKSLVPLKVPTKLNVGWSICEIYFSKSILIMHLSLQHFQNFLAPWCNEDLYSSKSRSNSELCSKILSPLAPTCACYHLSCFLSLYFTFKSIWIINSFKAFIMSMSTLT